MKYPRYIRPRFSVRTKDGGRLYQQYHYWAQLLCMKGDENQVENSTNELPRDCTAYIESVRYARKPEMPDL